MTTMTRFRLAVLATAMTAAALLTACGTTEQTSAAPAAGGSSAPAGPVTVTDARGKAVTLPAPATRVVGLEWG